MPASKTRWELHGARHHLIMECDEHNAKLIAEVFEPEYVPLLLAVPDLLAALKRFHNPEGCGDHCPNSCPQCQATAAIAKAEEKCPKT